MAKNNYRIIHLLKSKMIEIGLGLVCTVILVFINYFHFPVINAFIHQMDGRVYDQIVNLNWHTRPQSPRVVIIDIDDSSVQKEGRWPWPRDKMATLISKLKQDGVVTIGIDIVMSEPEINYALGLKDKLQKMSPKLDNNKKQLINTLEMIAPQIDNDQTFKKALLDHNVVLGFLFHNDKNIKKGALPSPINYQSTEPFDLKKNAFAHFEGYNGALDLFLKASTQAGFVTNLPDPDGTIRHSIILANYKSKLYPSLALKIAMNYLLTENIKLINSKQRPQEVELDGTIIPINHKGQVLIPFWGKSGTLDYYSASDILDDKVDPNVLQGAIAIIGSSMTLLADLHQSPVAQLFPGVEIVGNLVQGIIGQSLVTEYDWRTIQGGILIILSGILFSIVFPYLGVFGKFIILICGIFLILMSSFCFFVFYHLYVPSVLLILLISLQAIVNYSYSYMNERRQKKKISQLFGQYVPQDYVKELIEFPEQYSMEGQTRNMTVQFADIRNFTNISETLDATGVKHLLNTFFTPITEIIFRHRGTIDKYVGDMIVAFWGAPIEDKEHSYHAIQASLAIFNHLSEINEKMKANKLPTVNIGLGLATGLMNVGDMGSEFRRAYTVLGDTVNLASRLQDLTKYYQVNMLTNETARLENDMFLWKAIDKVAVKGRKTALTIYTPLGLRSEAQPTLLMELDEYHKALDQYYSQKWSEAEKSFTALKKAYPTIYLYQLYLERTHNFQKSPPPKDWDGVYIHTHK